METLTIEQPSKTTDFLPLNGTDHVEFYVGNAKQAAYYYKSAFGFQDLAYAGPETGVRDRASYVLQQGKIRLALTTPLHSDAPMAEKRWPYRLMMRMMRLNKPLCGALNLTWNRKLSPMSLVR
jgi:4-hydroxyphenylpyruvate dioxygenase-like putative hemolysin